MKKMSPPLFLGISLMLGAITVGAVVLIKSPPTAPEVREFVCYDDGKLTERHVGVHSARIDSDGSWYIKYTDEQHAFYQQHRGETCQVESYTSPPPCSCDECDCGAPIQEDVI